MRCVPVKYAIFATALAGALTGGAAHAGEAAGSGAGEVFRLSPEAKAEIEAAAYEREMSGLGLAESPPRRVHGEVSVMVGTGGSFGVAGTMVAPIGESGVAAFSFMHEKLPSYRKRQ